MTFSANKTPVLRPYFCLNDGHSWNVLGPSSKLLVQLCFPAWPVIGWNHWALLYYWRKCSGKKSEAKNMADFGLCWRQIDAIWFLRLMVFPTDQAHFWKRLNFHSPLVLAQFFFILKFFFTFQYKVVVVFSFLLVLTILVNDMKSYTLFWSVKYSKLKWKDVKFWTSMTFKTDSWQVNIASIVKLYNSISVCIEEKLVTMDASSLLKNRLFYFISTI